MPDELKAAPTIRSRAGSAGVDPERLAVHLEQGRLFLDGVPVTDLDAPAPIGTRIVIQGQRQ